MDYVQKGRSPFEKHGMITPHDVASFVKKKSSEAAKLLSKQRRELAKNNVHPHTMGSSGYVRKIPIWQKEIEDAINAGKEIPFANLDERSKNWMLGRRPTSSSCGELSFNKPETQEVVQKIAQIQAQVIEGSFVPDREHDILTKALGNPEHSGRTRGKGSKVPWKTGFSQDAHWYKSHRSVEQMMMDSLRQRLRQCTRRGRGKNKRNK